MTEAKSPREIAYDVAARWFGADDHYQYSRGELAEEIEQALLSYAATVLAKAKEAGDVK